MHHAYPIEFLQQLNTGGLPPAIFNTVSYYPQKVDGREQSDLTLTLYTTITEGREQSDLTSILYTATTNNVPHYHRKLMEGSNAT